MFYSKFAGNEVILLLVNGYDESMNIKMKTCVLTDGRAVLSLKKDRINNEKPYDLKIISSTVVDDTMGEICLFRSKKVKIEDANYIMVMYYLYSEDEKTWIMNNPRVLLNRNYSSLGELKFILFNNINLPSRTISEPESINEKELNEKAIPKRLLKSRKIKD